MSPITIRKISTLGFICMLLTVCSTFSSEEEYNHIMHGSITYPFVEEKPLGINAQKEKFVIRSIVGGTEYVVEIPGAGEDYDIEVPLASMDSQIVGGPDRPKGVANPAKTDRELTKSFPDPTRNQPKSALVDKAFGVGPKGGPVQGPSYTLGLATVTDLYKKKQFEYALLEINRLLSYYPTSPKLHKMKGTIYLKLNDLDLAEKAWIKALQLVPSDAVLRKSLQRLQGRIKLSQSADRSIPPAEATPK